MLISIILCGFLVKYAATFHQTDYEIYHHRMEIAFYNRSYVRNLKASLVPFNRTTRAINATFDLLISLTQNSIEMSFEVYKKSMNAYRSFPFGMDLNYCKIRRENFFGINDIEKHSNIPPCPVNKGHYYINEYRPDESKFPPHLFSGEFKAITNITYMDNLLVEYHWYGTVKLIEKIGWIK